MRRDLRRSIGSTRHTYRRRSFGRPMAITQPNEASSGTPTGQKAVTEPGFHKTLMTDPSAVPPSVREARHREFDGKVGRMMAGSGILSSRVLCWRFEPHRDLRSISRPYRSDVHAANTRSVDGRRSGWQSTRSPANERLHDPLGPVPLDRHSRHLASPPHVNSAIHLADLVRA